MNYYLSYDHMGRVRGVHLDRVLAEAATAKWVTECSLPEEWEMFSSAGNRNLTRKAEKFVTELANDLRVMAVENYFRSVRRLAGSKTMAEAGDTAVRDCVWSFALKFKDLFHGGEDELQRCWEGCW